MKTWIIFFALAFVDIVAGAKTPARHVTATPPPITAPVAEPDPLPESVPMARQLTVQEDLELRDWISGMMKEGELAKAETASTKLELKAAIAQSAVAEFRTSEAEKKLDTVDTVIAKKDAEIADQKKTISEQEKKIGKFNRLVGWLAAITATIAALYVFEMLKPAGLLGKALSVTGPAVQYGAPIVVWVIVFGAVQVWLRYFF